MKYSKEEIGKKIQELRQAKNWSQEQLGHKIGTTGKQISNYENGKLIPPMDVLLILCDIFSCELGYILCEEDYKAGTKLDTIIERRTGLNTDSLDALHLITGAERHSPHLGHQSAAFKRILNALFTEPSFRYLLEAIFDLDSCIAHNQELYEELEIKYGKEILDKALEYYYSSTDYVHDENAETLPDIYYQAMNAISDYEDKSQENSFAIKVNKYEVRESFERLLNSLYPQI